MGQKEIIRRKYRRYRHTVITTYSISKAECHHKIGYTEKLTCTKNENNLLITNQANIFPLQDKHYFY